MKPHSKGRIARGVATVTLAGVLLICMQQTGLATLQTAVWAAGFLCAPVQTVQAGQAVLALRAKEKSSLATNITTPSVPKTQPAAPMTDTATEPPQTMVRMAGAGNIEEKVYLGGTTLRYIATGDASIYNCTSLPATEVAAEVGQALPFSVQLHSSEPQVLILHTHATECYEAADRDWWDPNSTCRTLDTTQNMVAVGTEMARVLNEAGINTLHDTALHDSPSYTGSYANSRASAQAYLAKYPSIKIILDVHRDAIQRDDGTRVKPVVTLNGEKTAQVMIICGCDVDGNLPNCKQNLRFAARLAEKTAALYPGLMRPVLFDYRFYNQDLTTGCLLLEMGGHANTLAEALAAARDVGNALAALLAEEAT